MKTKVTNIAFDPNIPAGVGFGARVVNTITGPVAVQLGETVTVEMTDAEIGSAERTGWFHIGDNPPPPPAWAGKTVIERRGMGVIR